MATQRSTAMVLCRMGLGMLAALWVGTGVAAQTPKSGSARETPPPAKAAPKKPAPKAEKPAPKTQQNAKQKTEPKAAPKTAAASTGSTEEEIARRLTPAQQQTWSEYRAARGAWERTYRAYWRKAEARRTARRAKRASGHAVTAEDYVTTHPPRYQGPELPADIARIVASVRPPVRERPLPAVADFLAHAKKQFGFVPKRASEQAFKRSYAIEALKVGLSKDQVVRVYALETGGLGTYDMISGTNPVTKQGKPISSALGYAQLLHANSTGELVKHGEAFAKRLTAMAAARGTPPARAAELEAKAQILAKMLRAARSVPNEWKAHVRFAKTPKGLGIHALNLDADVGPWMQVLKLKSLKDSAARTGRADLSGAEIELMNLAGPGTGLEMMTPVGRDMPTANFFSEGGYARNPIVRDRTAAELLAALEARMEVHLKKAGSLEFARIFDEVAGVAGGNRQ
jgi:hypothetical protein